MYKSAKQRVLDKVKRNPAGTLLFADSFVPIGNAKAVNKALERLVNAGELHRVSFGIYVRPIVNAFIGKVTPSIEEIAVAIAKRDRARIVPTGSYALNRLGLSTQVPMNAVYLTDGSARKIKIDKRTITFKKASPKNVAAIGEISGLAIRALKAIGKDKVLNQEIKQIQELLKREKPTRLEHDIRLAPAWIVEIMRPVLQEIKNEKK